MVAWAMLPRISCRQRRRSKGSELFSCAISASVSPSKRPPHSFRIVSYFPFRCKAVLPTPEALLLEAATHSPKEAPEEPAGQQVYRFGADGSTCAIADRVS